MKRPTCCDRQNGKIICVKQDLHLIRRADVIKELSGIFELSDFGHYGCCSTKTI